MTVQGSTPMPSRTEMWARTRSCSRADVSPGIGNVDDGLSSPDYPPPEMRWTRRKVDAWSRSFTDEVFRLPQRNR
jgi:hypothetical protein